jgi:O-antigen ligase
MRVLKQKSNRIYFLVVLISVTTTLSLTSWMNVDALVIPKVIIVFCSAMFLFPLVLFNVRFFFTHLRLRILFFLVFCMLIQMIIVMFISSAPIEQQIFGKTGRGLGFLTEISILIITLITIRYVELKNLHYLVNGLVFSVCISSVYSIFQSFGLDLFAWYSRTNGIIGTLGNPNFQSAIAAISIVPASTYIWQKGFKPKFLSLITCLTLIYTIYICQSTQGYVVATLTILVSLLLYLWYRSRVFFYITSISAVFAGFISLAGMLNMGPLSGFLYKQSVSSRGEFFRTAVYGANDNPFFGVGLDSFGDFSQLYKSAEDYAGINEFTDSAHNYFLQYAVTGGYPLAVFYLFLTLLTLASFIFLQKKLGRFDIKVAAIFSAWVGFQVQSLISPGTIPLILWGSIINGTIIGLSVLSSQDKYIQSQNQISLFKPFGYLLLFLGLLISYPYFNVDRLQLKSLNTQDAALALKSAQAYPESVLRYSRIGVKLLESGLPDQALEVGRAAVKFNPNAVSAWALILANGSAPIEERKKAQQEILRLDPFNDEIRSIEFPD